MNAQSAMHPTLSQDLRRMAPVWLIVVGTAVAVVFLMRGIGERQLREAAYGNRSSCEYADVYTTAARQRLEKIRELAAQLRFQERQLEKSSLGLLASNDQVAKAREELDRAIALCPNQPAAHSLQAVVEWYAGNEAAAYYHLATYLRKTGRTEEALIQFEMALGAAPNEARSLLGKALCFIDLGRQSEALELVAQHEDTLVKTAEGKLVVGRLLATTSETARAEVLLKEGLKESPTDISSIWALYGILVPQGRVREAADFIYSLGEGDVPTIAQTYHIAAGLYRDLGDLPREDAALRKAVSLFPNNAGLLFDLSVNLWKQGKKSEARDEVKQAMEYDIDFVMKQIEATGVDPRK